MDEKCLICQEIHDPETYVFLGEIMDKFQNLLEGSEFDVNSVNNQLICKNCENKIETSFDFKSSFMEKEDELLNYVVKDHTVDLCAMLVTKDALEKRDCYGTLRVCRICFKSTEESNFKEIRTYDSYHTKLTTCYPDFDLFLTGTTYICPECEKGVLKFHEFYSSCLKAIENVTVLEDPLSLDIGSLIRERTQTAEAQNRKKSRKKSSPPVPVKRKRGRPRKIKKSKTLENECISNEEIERKLQKANAKEGRFSFECQVCPGIFDSHESLLTHMEFHEAQKKIICWKCGDLYPNLRLLRIHFYKHGMDIFKIVVEKEEESDDEEISDKIRRKSLPFVENRSIHRVNDTFQRIECQLCLQEFRNYRSFQKHIEDHEKVKEFICLKCIYSSESITDIQRHLATSHKIPNLYKVIPFRRKGNLDVEKSRADTTEKNLLPITNSSKYCCGHCSKIFFDLNALDDHTCTSQATENAVKIPFKNKPENGDNSSGNYKATLQELELNQSGEDDYECDFCSSSFKTLKALDNHDCRGDEDSSSHTTMHRNFKCFTCSLDFESCADLASHSCSKFGPTVDSNCSIGSIEDINEKRDKINSGSFNFVTRKGDQFKCSNCSTSSASYADLIMHSCDKSISSLESGKSLVKIEEQFYCSYCNASFDPAYNLNQHNCSTTSFPSKPEGFPDEPDYGDVKNNSGTEIDKHSGVVMSSTVQKNGDTNSVTIGSSALHCKYGKTEMANDNHIRKGEAVKASTKETPNKKEVISRIAHIFGVQSVDGASREKQNNIEKEFGCVGCSFKALKKEDLLIHINYCDKIRKCSYCPYTTHISDKLELHSYVVHDVMVFACSNCRFVTSMEENFKSHMSIHGGVVGNDKYLEGELNEHDYSKNWSELEDEINIKDEKVYESVHVEQKCNDAIGEASESEIEYIGEFFLSNNDQDVDNSYEVVDPIRIDNEGSRFHTSILNGETLLSMRQQNGGETCLKYVNSIEESYSLPTIHMPASETDVNDTRSALPSNDQESNDPHSEPYITFPESPTRFIIEKVSGNTDVIDINSDSDNEFIESNEDRATIVGEIRTVDHEEASQLILQGIPVVNNSHLLPMHIGTTEVKSDSEATETASEVGSNEDWSEFGLSSNHTVVKLLKEVVKKHDNINKETNSQQPTIIRQLCVPETANTEQNGCIVIDSDGESQTNQESDDDCVIVPNKANERISKKCSKTTKNHSSDSGIIKRPPNAFHLFFERLKKAMEKRLPSMKGTERRSIIVNIWKNMSYQEKWLYLEEARIQRLLFRREHPELCQRIPRKRKKLNLPESDKPHEEQSNLNEEIILD